MQYGIITAYSIIGDTAPRLRGTCVKHPRFAPGEIITTSPIDIIDFDRRYVLTQNTYYKLDGPLASPAHIPSTTPSLISQAISTVEAQMNSKERSSFYILCELSQRDLADVLRFLKTFKLMEHRSPAEGGHAT